MNKEEIAKYIDHTLLSPTADFAGIDKLCVEAIKYKTASVCIPQSYVGYVKSKFDVNICTVVGFPLGYNDRKTKVYEAEIALQNGADEIDMVINICDVKNGLYKKVTDEISEIKSVCGNKILKVIVETCYLTEAEKIEVCKCVSEAKADYIKTSTGFGTSGAVLSDIEIFKANISDDVKIKAAGGMKSVDDMIKFIEVGCSRLGTSSGIKLLFGEVSETVGY